MVIAFLTLMLASSPLTECKMIYYFTFKLANLYKIVVTGRNVNYNIFTNEIS